MRPHSPGQPATEVAPQRETDVRVGCNGGVRPGTVMP